MPGTRLFFGTFKWCKHRGAAKSFERRRLSNLLSDDVTRDVSFHKRSFDSSTEHSATDRFPNNWRPINSELFMVALWNIFILWFLLLLLLLLFFLA